MSGSIFWGIWGEAELILRIGGAKENYFQGAEVLSFRDLGRSLHYFQGSRELRPPPGHLNDIDQEVAWCMTGFVPPPSLHRMLYISETVQIPIP